MTMYLVNTTFQAELSVAEKFLEELDSFIPTVERSTALHSPVLTRVASHPAEGSADTATFALQFRAPSAAELDRYDSSILPELFGRLYKLFGERVLYFTTILEVIR